MRTFAAVAISVMASCGWCVDGEGSRERLSRYVGSFNASDEELYANAISNSAAEAFILANCPRFTCPDSDLERTYYFRWWTFRKHLRREHDRWVVTEFLPQVGWSGAANTIVCAAGHHFKEGRWLRNPVYLTDNARFWLTDPLAEHRWQYSSWLYTGTCELAEISGNDGLAEELLDAAVAYYRKWEEGTERRGGWMGGDGRGGFLSVDNYEGTELSLGGNGYKPLFASAMWSEANAIAVVARRCGRSALADEFSQKAIVVRDSVLQNCWDSDLCFFVTTPTNGVKGRVRELHGYSPWYFGVPTGKSADWSQLSDPLGFAGAVGLTFPERRAHGYRIDYEGHECKWNGPSWPFATSIALTALANDIHKKSASQDRRPLENLFCRLLKQYARQHRRGSDVTFGAGSVERPWIDENLHPDRQEWLARKIILNNPAMRTRFPRERGKDYNHSTFCDLIISGLIGVEPNGEDGFKIDPICPGEWSYFTLENLRYRGRDISLSWSATKNELLVYVDGIVRSRRNGIGPLKVDIRDERPRSPVVEWQGPERPVVESAREIPVSKSVDVLVVGGTAAGVAAAVAARDKGASVYLVGGFPYLGEDMAGTLELACATNAAEDSLERRLLRAGQSLAPYSYSQPADFKYMGGYQYVCDQYDKLSTTTEPKCPWDTVFYTNAVMISCELEVEEKIASIDVLVVENDDPEAEAERSVDHRGTLKKGQRGPLTGQVIATLVDGPSAGRQIELVRRAETRPIAGIIIRDEACSRQHISVFSAAVDADVHHVTVTIYPAEGASCHLVSRIRFRRPASVVVECQPTPLVVKRMLDRELLAHGIGYITGSPASDLVADERGDVAGVVIANRNGRQAVLAKSVIDATRHASLARIDGRLNICSSGRTRFTRVLQAGEPPQGVKSVEIGPRRHATHHLTEWPSLYRCELDLEVRDGSYRSLMVAEAEARELTWTRTMLDDADQLRPVFMPEPKSRAFLRTVSDRGTLSERLAAGRAAGVAAANEARTRNISRSVRVESVRQNGIATGDVCEHLSGLRPYEHRISVCSVHSPERDLPVLGSFDVVVVGAGSSGVPAAISASRGGANTLLIEYLHVLGGVGTDGMVLGYYCGNRCGFYDEFEPRVEFFDAEALYYRRAETWRRMCREANVEVWYGTLSEGAMVKGGKVDGVVVVTPYGRGVVLAKTVIDATGNADVAAAAGAMTEFLGSNELALQSAGQAPHRLRMNPGNSDFGLVNDADALDLWLFGVRSRAGAPDAWDIQQLVDSRERRRIVSDYALTGWDVVSNRKFADTISIAYSRQDGHGYFSDEFGCISPDDGLEKRFVHIPLRSLLPRGISGVAVTGLGKGVARDVVPFTRMQADLMNEGFGVGLCAAAAARESNGDFRAFNLRRVQRMLVEKGNLPPEALSWTDEQPVPTDADLKDLVAAMASGNRGSERLYVFRERARPFLAEAYRVAEKPESRQIYAVMLGLMGDATGAETLAALMDDKQPIALRKRFSYGRSMTVIGVAIAAGRTKAKVVEGPIRRRIDRLTAESTITQYRMATLAAEAYASPSLAESLAAALERPGVGGWARAKLEDLGPMGGYGVGPEIDRCTKELALARALWACGDCRGLARRILEAYANDPRGVYAEHAACVLLGKSGSRGVQQP